MLRSFTYDAENRQVTATIGSATATYAYDGLGQRVSKTVNGQTTTYVYDAFGNLAAEYGGSSTSPCNTATCYVTVDHLGSTRLLTDSSGNPVKRYDYLPFGEEIFAGVDNRSTGYDSSPSPDASDPKFTGQYRDPETVSNVGNELDWFNVRYFSGAQGRFQSPDPANAGADPSNPQTWNGYSYVANNPLSYTDPSGMFLCGICVGAETGNPVGIAIGAAIDIGAALVGIFGFGGGPPASIPSSLATPSSPIMGAVGDVDISGLSGGWYSQCGFLYGSVCGIAPLNIVIPYRFSVDHNEEMSRQPSPQRSNESQQSIPKCANELANEFSIAGVIESGFDTRRHPLAKWTLDAFAGNAFAGIGSIPEDFKTDPYKTYGDVVGGGLSQGLPGLGEALTNVGVPMTTAKGVIGAVEDATLTATPLTWGKFGFDLLVYGGSAARCYFTH